MKPWVAAILAFATSMKKRGIGPGEGIDKYFLDRSDQAKDKKRVVAMESSEEQLKLLSGVADDIQESFLADAMELLLDRNLHKADVAEQFFNGKEQEFVVVGAAHVVARDGVVSILEKHGYQLEQVSARQ
jgi:uncharacterized protein